MLPTHLLSVRSQPSCHTVGTLLEAPPGRILLSRTSPLQPRSQLHFCNYLFGYLIDIWPLSLDYKFQILITVSAFLTTYLQCLVQPVISIQFC